MARRLDVYLHRDFVGRLEQDDHGALSFAYAQDWLARRDAIPLSQSLPLQEAPFRQKDCHGFFGGLLPEEGPRQVVARILGISPRNDFSMLERIGGECAGAVTFLPEGTDLPEPGDAEYRPLSEDGLHGILKQLPRRPLMAGEAGIRLSLAGAQSKIAVHVVGDRISLPLGGAPSTHILKPTIAQYPGVVKNEAFCLQLASAVGLPAVAASAYRIGEIDYILVERYDRRRDENGRLRRIHQEDFCQALGVASEMKYQSEGGPSLKSCFALLREASSSPVLDLRHLLDAAIFNALIGNNDAHAKNFSLLYGEGGTTRFAPLYDLICTAAYPELSDRMAMKIGGEYRADLLGPRHFEKLARDAGLAAPMVKRRVVEVAQAVKEALTADDLTATAPEIAEIIDRRAERFAG